MSERLDATGLPITDQGMFKTGATVGDRYRLNQKVGEGAFGEVWSGVNIATGERVALKRLHSSVAANVESFRRFKREASLLARVKSEHVAKLIDFLPDLNHGLVLVLEFIDGAPLSELFEVQTISVEMAIDIGVDMLCALRDLHALRIIHRDIKPANVILRPLPNGDSEAIICDFSTSRLVGRQPGARHTGNSMGGSHSMSASLTPTNATLGTLHYMSPEQILSSRDVSERTDIYAVGAVLFRGVAGRHVFEEHSGPVSMARHKLMQEAPRIQTGRSDQVAREFEDVLARALRRRPQDRYQSAVDMLAAFQRLHQLAANNLDSETRLMPDRASLVGDEPELLAAALAASARPSVVPPPLGNPEGGFPKPLQASSSGNPEGGFPKPLQVSSSGNPEGGSARPLAEDEAPAAVGPRPKARASTLPSLQPIDEVTETTRPSVAPPRPATATGRESLPSLPSLPSEPARESLASIPQVSPSPSPSEARASGAHLAPLPPLAPAGGPRVSIGMFVVSLVIVFALGVAAAWFVLQGGAPR